MRYRTLASVVGSVLGFGGGVAGVGSASAQEFRSYDGFGNNLTNPEWGQAMAELRRGSSGAHYADGIGEMVSRENPRVISNRVVDQTNPQGNSRGFSAMVWLWGQFVDHDLDLVAQHRDFFDPIIPPIDDPVFPPGSIIPFTRSIFNEGVDTARQHQNVLSAYVDASQVYSVDLSRGLFLREGVGGRMRLGADGLLPRNENGDWANGNEGDLPDEVMFLAGDVRANENSALASMHTIWVREHNRWADRLIAENPGWDDELTYQMARKIVGAEIQKITYEEWLPVMLGGDGLGSYAGYDDTVNAGIATSFAGATFRFGHTMVGEVLERYNADGTVFGSGHLTLLESFFNPGPLEEIGGLDAILRGMVAREAEEFDSQVVDSLRNFLFDANTGGLDLAAVNMKRGRDLGIPDYNTLRQELGLDAIDEFSDITSDGDLAAALESLYGDVNNIDAWVGMISEDHVAGAVGGELFVAALTDQFTRLRDGDRFFYLNDADLSAYLDEIRGLTLADVISLNSGAELFGNVFFVPAPGAVGVLAIAGIFGVRRRR